MWLIMLLLQMGPSFVSHQPVMFNHQAAPMQSPQTYYHPTGPQVTPLLLHCLMIACLL